MKKVLLGVVAGVSSIALLTGCGDSGNKLKCTAKFEEGGMSGTAEVVAELDNDKIKDVSQSYIFSSEDEADQFYASYQAIIELTKQFAEEGDTIPDFGLKKDGKKVTISNFAAFSEMESSDGEKIIGMSKDDFIKKLEEQAEDGIEWSCK